MIMRTLCLLALACCAAPAAAQTCASPIQINTTSSVVTGTTCAGTTQLPSLANGAMIGGQQIVHRITLGSGAQPGINVSLQPEAGVDMALFVCPNACSPVVTCSAVDAQGAGGTETAPLPNTAGDYYIIVQSSTGTAPVCGGYSLVVTAPLND